MKWGKQVHGFVMIAKYWISKVLFTLLILYIFASFDNNTILMGSKNYGLIFYYVQPFNFVLNR
jgi:hypothetical protein